MRQIFLLVALLWGEVLLAQTTFIKKFDFTGYDSSYSLLECEDGYIIMSICEYEEGQPTPPILIKINKQGEKIWTFNPAPTIYYSDFPIVSHRCILAPDSTIMVCGRMAISETQIAAFVTKVSLKGALIWTKWLKEYNPLYESYYAEQIATWPNGDFVVTGVYYRIDQGNSIYPDSMFFLKCNAAGDLIRETKINYPPVPFAGYEGGDSGNPVILPDGDIFYCFFARWNTRYHPILARLDSTLQLRWRKEADGVMGRSYELKMAEDGNILMYVEGGYNGYPWGADPIVQKLTPDGDSLWTYSPPGINSQQCYDMSTLTNGDIVFTGTPSEFEWLRCISPDGKYKWHRKFKPPDSRPNDRLQLTRIMGTTDGGMLIAGYYDKYPDTWEEHLDADVILIKLDSVGCLTPGCGEEEIFVSAKEPVDDSTTESFMIQPNPASDAIKISANKNMDAVEIMVFDLQGRIILNRTISNLMNAEPVDVHHLQSGLYIVQMVNLLTGRVTVQKLLIMH